MPYDRYRSRPFVVEVALVSKFGAGNEPIQRYYEPTPGEAQLRARRYSNTPNLLYCMVTFPGIAGEVVYLFTDHLVKDNLMGVKELPGSRGNMLAGTAKQFFAEYHVPFNISAIGEREENENFSKKNDKYYERRLTLQITQNTHEVLAHASKTVETPTLPEDGIMVLPLRDTFNQENDYRAGEFSYVEEQLATNGVAADMVLKRVQSGNNTLYKLALWDGRV